MIFVTLGTQKQQFTRILDLIENSSILKNEEIIVQAGHTSYDSKFMKIFDFLTREDMKKYTKEADYIITHGGVGSVIDALNMSKKVLAIPRLKKYKEHVDDHQLEICEKLSLEGYMEYLAEGEDIDKKLELMKSKNYKKYVSDKKYLEIIKNDIENFIK